MAYDGRVYRILIASPSDVEEEREIAVRVIQEWNDLYSYSRKVILLPLRWEKHTAPEYGTRPQEVINRAIVDHCDLLVGIFWTRIGTPTGDAKSGTLEEINRVGKAGKPVMLYFSKVGIDPDTIDLDQVRRLKDFKDATYPNSLNESYKSMIDFRDKFAKQLELKLRELRKTDVTGLPPLSLSFLSMDTGELLGDKIEKLVKKPNITDLTAFLEESISIPVILAIKNMSSSGISNLYVEVSIEADKANVRIADSIGPLLFVSDVQQWVSASAVSSLWSTGLHIESSLEKEVNLKMDNLNEKGLVETDDGWKISFEWRALQPQRMRFMQPPIFITAQEPSTINFTGKIFADSFTQPLILTARIELKVAIYDVKLDNFIPNIDSLLGAKIRYQRTAQIS
jgi:hypothetical protein